MQGLKESGTFSSLIVSAQKVSSGVELLSSMKDHNTSSNAIEGSYILSKKNDETKESESTGRKVLEVSDIDLLAVPPLAPPIVDDGDI